MCSKPVSKVFWVLGALRRASRPRAPHKNLLKVFQPTKLLTQKDNKKVHLQLLKLTASQRDKN